VTLAFPSHPLFTVHCWRTHRTRVFPHTRDASYWNPLTENDTPDQYATTIEGFFRATLRCRAGHPSGYTIPLTEVQAAEADRLSQSLRLSPSDKPEGEIAKEILETLHQFSVSLLAPQPEADDLSAWSCPVRCYLAARAIREDGNFITPNDLSPKLARFKYFCNNCALVQADRMKDSTPNGMIG